MESIGVRELRQHASRYLARVAAGESIEITDRRRPVARLVPPQAGDWSDLLATGRLLPPERPGDIVEEPPDDHGVDASATLTQQRDSER